MQKQRGRPSRRPAVPHTRRRKYGAPARERQARATGGRLRHVSVLLGLLPEVAIARAMRAEEQLGAGFSPTVVVRRRTPEVELPVGGAR